VFHEVTIDCKYGRLRLAITQGDHIHADANANSKGDLAVGLTLRGVRYGASAHLHKWSDGRWHLGTEADKDTYKILFHHLYVSRADSYTKEPSRSAREALGAEIERAVSAWADSVGALVFDEAQAAHVARRVETLQDEIGRLLAEVREKEAQIATLRASVPEGVR
jgi:hypothetical protein